MDRRPLNSGGTKGRLGHLERRKDLERKQLIKDTVRTLLTLIVKYKIQILRKKEL